MLIELKGLGKLAYNNFPNNHEGLELELQRTGHPSTVLHCQKKAREYKPDIMFLMETKLAKDKGAAILGKCGFWNGWEVPQEGLSGGVLLGWMGNQSFNILYSSKQLLYVDLIDNKGNPLSISFLQGHPNHAKREEVWTELRNIRNLVHKTQLCIGDFNQIISQEDKFGFSHRRIEGEETFRQTLFDLGLYDIEAKGQKFT